MSEASKTEALPLFDHLLRPYQKDSHVAVRTSYKSGKKRVLIELPTGTGKTRTFVLLPREGARTLVVVPMIELIGQAVRAIRDLRDCEPDVEQAGSWAVPETEFVVGSWQTLLRNDRYKRFIGKVDLVVVDEAHWGFTTQARDMLNELVDGGARVLGVTATAYRADRKSLMGFYEEIPYCLSLRQAIDEGWLVPPKVRVHYVRSIDVSGLAKKSAADFAPEELDKILRSEEALHDLAALINQNHRPGAKGLVFAHSVMQATMLRNLMVDRHGVQCSLVHSYQSDDDYKEELDAFMVGDRELIINVGILTTGWDYPPLSEIFLAKPTKALNKYTQMVGRGTRSHGVKIDDFATAEERKAAIAASSKPHFVIHDITDSSRCHKLCSAMDVLCDQAIEIKEKIKRGLEDKESSLDEIDEAVKAEIKHEHEAKRLLREVERKRREGIKVGVEFDHEDHDPFAEADRDTARRREWRMPFGKHKGQPMKSVDRGYLEWMLREARLTPMWRKAVAGELDRRAQQARFGADTPSQRQFQRQLDDGRRYAREMADLDRRAQEAMDRDR
jgi:superfamily II DNA or RNA helicase